MFQMPSRARCLTNAGILSGSRPGWLPALEANFTKRKQGVVLMNKTLYLLLGATAGAAAMYLYLNSDATSGLSDAADQANLWGSKQRVTGSGGQVVGKIKQGFGEATGNDQLANEGMFDQVKGAVKNAAGQAAHAAVDAVQQASK
jgi:uncharacterized protein YjbJ (UPF0337 family)